MSDKEATKTDEKRHGTHHRETLLSHNALRKRGHCIKRSVLYELLEKASPAVLARSMSDEAISQLLEILNDEFASLARTLKKFFVILLDLQASIRPEIVEE